MAMREAFCVVSEAWWAACWVRSSSRAESVCGTEGGGGWGVTSYLEDVLAHGTLDRGPGWFIDVRA